MNGVSIKVGLPASPKRQARILWDKGESRTAARGVGASRSCSTEATCFRTTEDIGVRKEGKTIVQVGSCSFLRDDRISTPGSGERQPGAAPISCVPTDKLAREPDASWLSHSLDLCSLFRIPSIWTFILIYPNPYNLIKNFTTLKLALVRFHCSSLELYRTGNGNWCGNNWMHGNIKYSARFYRWRPWCWAVYKTIALAV